jgi:DNA-binding MarR family transcriptional regulator
MADKDWTDALLDRLADSHSRQEIEPYQVTARVSRIAQHLARRQEEAFGGFKLNRGEVGVLGALLLAGSARKLSPTQLFKGLMLSSAGITSRLDRLERRGYIQRTRHPTDRRGVLVALTDAGRHVLDQAVSADAAVERQLLSGLTRKDRAGLITLLKKLLAGLESIDRDGSAQG